MARVWCLARTVGERDAVVRAEVGVGARRRAEIDQSFGWITVVVVEDLDWECEVRDFWAVVLVPSRPARL